MNDDLLKRLVTAAELIALVETERWWRKADVISRGGATADRITELGKLIASRVYGDRAVRLHDKAVQ